MEVQNDNLFLEQFRLKRLIKKLENAKGNGTSLITLIIPAGKRISDSSTMIVEEIGKADNIKDRVNRQSVVMALNSVKEKLRTYNRLPKNGLAIFCGNGILEGHTNERKIMYAIEPYKEITSKVYNCGTAFDLDILKNMLVSNERYGFIIVDGNGALFGLLQGNNRSIIHQFYVDLPKKHGRGGQSSNRFARIRTERRLIYTKRVCEEATKAFITDSKANVDGIVLAGYADFKTNVVENNIFDPRLKPIVLKVVDISYGGDAGFVQAINASQDCFKNVRLVQEQKVLDKFYTQINFDTGKFCSGVDITMKNLNEKFVETLIVYDQLEYQIADLKPKDPSKGTEIVKRYLKKSETDGKRYWIDKETNIEYQIMDYDSLIDWITENYMNFQCELFFVTDKSPQGHQFVKGFGGIGALMKCKVDNANLFFFEEDSQEETSEGEWI